MSKDLFAIDLSFRGTAIFRGCICPLIEALLLFFVIFGCSLIHAISSNHHVQDFTTTSLPTSLMMLFGQVRVIVRLHHQKVWLSTVLICCSIYQLHRAYYASLSITVHLFCCFEEGYCIMFVVEKKDYLYRPLWFLMLESVAYIFQELQLFIFDFTKIFL